MLIPDFNSLGRTNGFWSLFVHMKNTNFDVASDAVTTFKELLVNSETKKVINTKL